MNIKLRLAAPTDAARLLEIYSYYVRQTTVSFEYDVPTETEFRERIVEYSSDFPYIICEIDGRIEGYAYAHKYKTRYAYRYSAELSVYLSKEFTGNGIGKRLYQALIELLCEMGYKNLYGTVTGENAASIAFHKVLGFVEAGREHRVGYKFGKWIDVIIFEKIIGEKTENTFEGAWFTTPKTVFELDCIEAVLKKFEG